VAAGLGCRRRAGFGLQGTSGPDPKLSDEQLARLRQRLEHGPAAAGYGEEQRWTLIRVVALIATLFHLRISVTTAWQAMRQLGYTAQLPIHRAAERDEAAMPRGGGINGRRSRESQPAAARGSVSPTSAAKR
jgi:putative transposase